MSKPYKRADSQFWWIGPIIDGRQVCQSSGFKRDEPGGYDQAHRKLKILEGKIAGGAPITAKTDRGSFLALLEAVRTDYKIHKRASLYDLELRIDNHVGPALGHLPAGKITRMVIAEYIESRQGSASNPTNATINRELAIIRRALKLGVEDRLVSDPPKVKMLPEDNVRQGFFTEDGFRAMIRHANPLLADVMAVCFCTGWRIDSILNLEWANVDFEGGVIRLRKNQTKNRTQTVFPLASFPILVDALKRRQAACKGMITPWVFHRGGDRVRSIRTAFDNTRVKVGLPGRLIHDFRRTAVRRLKELGWSDTEIMSMVGLKTMSMLIRYGITVETDILKKAKAMERAAADGEESTTIAVVKTS